MMKLSILICSLVSRGEKLLTLVSELMRQSSSEVEVLTNVDNKQKTVGAKRNELLARAQGEYVAFVDDDDMVSQDYVEKILKAIESSPDCCGIEGLFRTDDPKSGLHQKYLFHSLKYKEWKTVDKTYYYRTPNHLNPVRRVIAAAVEFPNISAGEDGDFSARLLPLLHNEQYIEGPIYYYIHSMNDSQTSIRRGNVCFTNSIGGDFSLGVRLAISPYWPGSVEYLKMRQQVLRGFAPVYKPSRITVGSKCLEFRHRSPSAAVLHQRFHVLLCVDGEIIKIVEFERKKMVEINLTREKDMIRIDMNGGQVYGFQYSVPSCCFAFENVKLDEGSIDLVLDGYKWVRPWF